MAPANSGRSFQPESRSAWRRRLERNHARSAEIWLICFNRKSGKRTVAYDAAVGEALCFGWIDGMIRRLLQAGKMTAAGRAVLPDLSLDRFQLPEDIVARLRADRAAWKHFPKSPEAHQRVRIGFRNDSRQRPEIFDKRLACSLRMTRENKMYGTQV